jgi:hypothetical protein
VDNFNILRFIASRIGSGYTTAIASMKYGVIVAPTRRSAEAIRRIVRDQGSVVDVLACSDIDIDKYDPRDKTRSLIPDNQLLYLAVKEADEEIQRLRKENAKLKICILMAKDVLEEMTT